MPYELVEPDEKLDFSFDWSEWVVEGDDIATHAWTISPDHGSAGPFLDGASTAAVVVSGLQRGVVYRLTETVTTDAGLIGVRSITLRCEVR